MSRIISNRTILNPTPVSRTLAKAAAVGAIAAALVLGAPLAASAHVHVDPESAEPGGYSLLTFRVPNESATAATTAVEITLPTDTPFTSVSVEPVQGWTAEVLTGVLSAPVDVGGTTITEAPLSVRFAATSAGIASGEFQRFTISVGPVPDTGSILLPVTQTYSDGTVVAWDEPTPESGEEPEKPAPTLYITDSAPEGDHGATTVSADDHEPATEAGSDAPTDATGTVVGFIALVLAALALVVSALSFSRSRAVRTAQPAASEKD